MKLVAKETKEDQEIYKRAVAAGCSPLWHDGIYGWAWHCTCPGNHHGCDSQCSAISLADLPSVPLEAT